MRRELLKILTEEDIDEILETEKSLWRDTAVPTSGDVLRKLLDKYEYHPSIGERFSYVLSCAEKVVGKKLSRNRSKEDTTIRAFVSYALKREGYGYSEIGRLLERDHSTVIHLYNKVKDMLSVPNVYREEIEMLRTFELLLDNTFRAVVATKIADDFRQVSRGISGDIGGGLAIQVNTELGSDSDS